MKNLQLFQANLRTFLSQLEMIFTRKRLLLQCTYCMCSVAPCVAAIGGIDSDAYRFDGESLASLLREPRTVNTYQNRCHLKRCRGHCVWVTMKGKEEVTSRPSVNSFPLDFRFCMCIKELNANESTVKGGKRVSMNESQSSGALFFTSS